MNRLLLAALLLLGSLGPALAQRLVNRTAALASGQGVFLDLKFANTIRVRLGAGLSVQARVSINDNQQNGLYSLNLQPAASELSVIEKVDEEKLRQTNFTGDCGGSRHNSSGGKVYGYTRSPKGSKQPTAVYYNGEHSYCLKIDYEVTVPAGAALRIATISGDVDLSGLSGPVTVKTVSGNLLARNLAGALTVRSVSGDVKLNNLSSSAVEATSVSGNVDLSWPPARSAALTMKTITGEVYADPAVTFSNLKARSYVGYELRGSYGSGPGPLVKLESVSGDVFFRKQP